MGEVARTEHDSGAKANQGAAQLVGRDSRLAHDVGGNGPHTVDQVLGSAAHGTDALSNSVARASKQAPISKHVFSLARGVGGRFAVERVWDLEGRGEEGEEGGRGEEGETHLTSENSVSDLLALMMRWGCIER